MASSAIWSLPAIALVTYIFAFPHYKFRSQILFFLGIIAFTLQLAFVDTSEARICACVGLALISVINVFRFTAPQV